MIGGLLYLVGDCSIRVFQIMILNLLFWFCEKDVVIPEVKFIYYLWKSPYYSSIIPVTYYYSQNYSGIFYWSLMAALTFSFYLLSSGIEIKYYSTTHLR